MSSNSNIAIIIPAAGASTRFGSPKQLVKWKNTTLIGHAIAKADALQQNQIFVILGANIEVIRQKIDSKKVTIVNNQNWEHGLGTSIAAGVNHILQTKVTYDAVLVLLADQPLVTIDYLTAIIEQFEPKKGQIIATKYSENKLGVPAIFDQKYFKELSKLTHDKGAKDLINNNLHLVSVPKPTAILTDIDTQEDYKNIVKTNRQS
jgi:molybdenum cofactor cytidylyltransferase